MVYAYSITDDKDYCDVARVELEPRMPVGTALAKEGGDRYRYACAGEDLQPGVFVKPGLSEGDRFTLAFSRKMEKFADIIFGKVIATVGDLKDNPGVLGWPIVEVKKGCYFWIREIPVGATLLSKEQTDEIWMRLWNNNIKKHKNEPPSFAEFSKACEQAQAEMLTKNVR